MFGGRDSAAPRGRAILAALWIAGWVGGCAPEPDRPSVLLLTLDTTRADRLGAYGREDAGTRHLDALAREGALFEWAFTPVPLTLPAHATILTGTYPSRHGIRDNGARPLDGQIVTLAEILEQADYRTAAFVSAFPLYRQFGLDQGFEVYDVDIALPQGPNRLSRQRLADQVVGAATRWLEALHQNDRFFLWVHFFDPHASYLPPPPYASWYADDPYQGEIAYMDEWIGKLLARLDQAGRAADTLVVAVADHGEGLGEHQEATHSTLIYNSTMRVPLILRGPGIRAGVRVGSAVSTVDLLPTLLELLSLDPPPQLEGTSLTPLLAGGTAPSREIYLESLYPRLHHGWSELQGVVAEGWKYIEAPRAEGNGELFELASDPDEQRDRSAQHPERVRRLRAALDSMREQRPNDASNSPPPALGDDERQALEALGYLTERAELVGDRGHHPRDMMRISAAAVEARGAIEGRELQRAARLLEEIEGLEPGSLIAHELRGELLLERGERDPSLLPGALAEFQAVLLQKPHSPRAWRYTAEAYLALGDWPAGLRHFSRALEVAPPMPDLQRDYRSLLGEARERAALLERSGDHEAAEALRDVLSELAAEDDEAALGAEAPRSRIARE